MIGRVKVIEKMHSDSDGWISAGNILNNWVKENPKFNITKVTPVIEKHSYGDMGRLGEETYYIVYYEEG